MINQKYLIRLDDACPTMDSEKWNRVEQILDKNGIKPLVGVIPENADPKQKIDPIDSKFWEKVKKWEYKGWEIALHGYDHLYISNEKGINPLWSRSEFAGVPLNIQKEKIHKGLAIFNDHNITPKYFFAPSHTFDENTLIALKEETEIRIISDTIATKPYRKGDFIFIPQLGGIGRSIPISGTWTLCLHPNIMTEDNFSDLCDFIKKEKHKFISFEELSLEKIKSKSILSKFISSQYFLYRKIRDIFNLIVMINTLIYI